MSGKWDATTREKYKASAQLVIGLVIGTLVALPSVVGLLRPPLVFPWGIFIVLALAALSLALLGIVIAAAMIESQKEPLKLIGSGNWIALAALGTLLVYLLLNLFDDLVSPPSIVAVKASPTRATPTTVVDLDVEASDQRGSRLEYMWKFGDVEFSRRRNAYFKTPEKPGVYVVSVTVMAGGRAVDATQAIEVIPNQDPVAAKEPTPAMVQICNPGVKSDKPRNPKPPASSASRPNQC